MRSQLRLRLRMSVQHVGGLFDASFVRGDVDLLLLPYSVVWSV